MELVRWEPFNGLTTLHSRINELFDIPNDDQKPAKPANSPTQFADHHEPILVFLSMLLLTG